MAATDIGALENKYRATKLWNDAIRSFCANVPIKKHRRQFRSYENSFSGREGVDYVMMFLRSQPKITSSIAREQALLLFDKFYKQGIFECVSQKACLTALDDHQVLYRFTSMSPSKVARTPLVLKQAVARNKNAGGAVATSSPYNYRGSFRRRSLSSSVTPISYRKCLNGENGNGAVFELFKSPQKVGSRVAGGESTYSLATFLKNNSPSIVKTNVMTFPNDDDDLQLVSRPMTHEETYDCWKMTFFRRLRSLIKTEFTEVVVPSKNVNGQVLRRNSVAFTSNGICKVEHNADDLPRWVLEAIKCLGKWPWSRNSVKYPLYPGFENDVFKTIVDYFNNPSDSLGAFLLTQQHSDCLLNVFSRCEFLDLDAWDKSYSSASTSHESVPKFEPDSASSNTLIQTSNFDRANACRASISLPSAAKKARRAPIVRGYQIETEFSSEDPVSRLVPAENYSRIAPMCGEKTPMNFSMTPPLVNSKQLRRSAEGIECFFAKSVRISPLVEHADKRDPLFDVDPLYLNSQPIPCKFDDPPTNEQERDAVLDNLPGLRKTPDLMQKFKKTDWDRTFNSDYSFIFDARTGTTPGMPVLGLSGVKTGGRSVVALPRNDTGVGWYDPRSRQSLAVALGHSTQLRQDQAQSSAKARLRFSVAEPVATSLANSRYVNHLIYEVQSATANFVTAEGRNRLIDCLQLVLLSFPAKTRRRLQILLRLMHRVSQNRCLHLAEDMTNRTLVLDAFCRCVVSYGQSGITRHQSLKLVSFLMDHHIEVFAKPTQLVTLVTDRIGELKKEKVTYVSANEEQLAFCDQISSKEYENQRNSMSKQALVSLLDSIMNNERLKSKEKKNKLIEFRKLYPDIFELRFPTSESLDAFFPPTKSANRLLDPVKKFKALRI